MVPQIHVKKVDVAEILTLRDLYRQEMNCQIRHDAWHQRGFNDSYLIRVDSQIAGYGTVTKGSQYQERGILNEFYLLPTYKALAVPVFRQLLDTSQATKIQAQTNDVLLMLMLYDFATEITGDTILFHDARTTNLSVPDGVFRKATQVDADRIFQHQSEPVGDWLIEVAGNIVATGGFLTHYNPPYGDIYMEVAEPYRRRGYGSYLVQELKRVCYEAGRRPAARCNAANVASRKTLEKAGLLPCARILSGGLSPDQR
ncbi:GNAT family N-acetyltransferase [Candidatus Poribacteria bacterium]|nr:GNAT family N-acetyltransferase [Candidatus Poribacteria bacterium]